MSEDTDIRILSPANCRFFHSADGVLRAEVADELCCLQVVLRRLFPVRLPDRYLSVGDGSGKEVGMITDLAAFDRDTRRMLEKELDYYYGMPVISDVHKIKEEYGFYHWDAATDRGHRTFYVKGRVENVTRVGERGVFITDIHNCRYHIPDWQTLPRAGRNELQQVL